MQNHQRINRDLRRLRQQIADSDRHRRSVAARYNQGYQEVVELLARLAGEQSDGTAQPGH